GGIGRSWEVGGVDSQGDRPHRDGGLNLLSEVRHAGETIGKDAAIGIELSTPVALARAQHQVAPRDQSQGGTVLHHSRGEAVVEAGTCGSSPSTEASTCPVK